MAITSETVFNRVVVFLLTSPLSSPHLRSIRVRQDEGQYVDYVLPTGRGRIIDPEDPGFVECRRRIVNGTATLHYLIIEGSGYDGTADFSLRSIYTEDNLPTRFHFLLQYDTMRLEVQRAQEIDPSVGPTDKIFYTYATIPPGVGTTIPTPVPTWADGDVDGLISSMEDLHWYTAENQAYENRGVHETLYTCVVSYHYIGDLEFSSIDVTTPETGAIQFSTNHGDTWTDERPSTGTITHVRRRINGHWVEFPLEIETVLRTGIEVVISEMFLPWQDSEYPRSYNISRDDISEIDLLILMAERTISWGDARTPIYGNFSSGQVRNEITLLRPHLIGQDAYTGLDDLVETGVGLHVLTINKNTGHVTVGHTMNEDIDSYAPYSGYATFLFGWESYPATELQSAMTAISQLPFLKGSNFGLAVGNTLFCEAEQMRIDAMTSEHLNNGALRTQLQVTRGINGTTAAVHAVDTPIRAIVNGDEIRRITYLDHVGTDQPFRVRLLGHKQREEIA